MLETLDIFVLTCDKSIHCCDIFQHIYQHIKLKKSKIYFLGYEHPKFKLLDNFYFISINPQDSGPKCTTYIKNFFESYDKKYFILTVDDHIPVIQNNENSQEIYDFITSEENNIGRYGLTHDISINTQNVFYKNINNKDYVSVLENSQYKLSLVWSIWNKNFLLENLKNNQDLWEFETIQNQICKLNNYKICGTKNYKDSFLDTSHLYKRGILKKNTYMYTTYLKNLIDISYIDIINKIIKL